MGYLYDIAQRHLDAYGVRAAALAKRMGTAPQTLDSWKNRGLKELPDQWLLEALARETRTPYGDVLTAVLRDIGYLPKERERKIVTIRGGKPVGRGPRTEPAQPPSEDPQHQVRP